ncbi:uncharacterized protein LOC112347223 [Selaginella moellendorffii]|uniref:uncharacterized protein LOC112347223 n=1 Tax=Selaginella moellendorffii TaxID=88036 RepID=UPI000D1CABF0|nr:uncharacterized protein LOC112347223 [Selaginella moellendorffii]|eukprot:XP_024533524.1 uncharacterized protein LOC112347223 [Selaginella moellendorffii]
MILIDLFIGLQLLKSIEACGGFSQTCHNIFTIYDNLWAICDPSPLASSFSLDLHISNNNGTLETPGSGFYQTCYGLEVIDMATESESQSSKGIAASCKDFHGGYQWTSLSLDERVENKGGNLNWCG